MRSLNYEKFMMTFLERTWIKTLHDSFMFCWYLTDFNISVFFNLILLLSYLIPCIQSIPGDIKTEFNGVLYHEMTHIWQSHANHQAPNGLIEGIADFVRLKADYVPNGWVKSGEGQRWDEGYSVTARFLDYCNGLHQQQGFVAQLNKKMRDGYSDSFFHELLGKTVDQLWTDYKAKFAN